MRAGAAAVLLAAALLVSACPGREPTVRRRGAARDYGTFPIRPLSASLETIDDWLQRHHLPSHEALQAGRDEKSTTAALQAAGFRCPPEVHRLFAWHDGQATAGVMTLEPDLVPSYRMQSLDEALATARMLRGIHAGPLSWWRRSYLPLLDQQTGDFFAVDCLGGEVYDWVHDDPDAVIGHASLAAFFQEIAEYYESGAYFIDDEGTLQQDERREVEIFRRYHPSLPSRRALTWAHVTTSTKKGDDGSRVVVETSKDNVGLQRQRTFDPRGRLVHEELRSMARLHSEVLTDFDDAGRPLAREHRVPDQLGRQLGYRVAWRWHDETRATICRRDPDGGLRVVEASRSPGASWSVLAQRLVGAAEKASSPCDGPPAAPAPTATPAGGKA